MTNKKAHDYSTMYQDQLQMQQYLLASELTQNQQQEDERETRLFLALLLGI